MIEASGGTSTARSWRVLVGATPRDNGRPARRSSPATHWAGEGPLAAPAGEVTRVELVVDSVGWLRRLLAQPAGAVDVRDVTVRLLDWKPPRPEWSGRLGPLPGLRRHQVLLPAGRSGEALVEVEVRDPRPLYEVLSAVLAVLAPVRPLPRPASADVTALDAVPVWLAAEPNHMVCAGPLPENHEIRPHDIVLAADPSAVEPEPLLFATALAADRTGARVTGRHAPVLVDPAVANPIGRDKPFGPDAPEARLEVGGDPGRPDWRLTGPDGRVLAQGPLAGLPMSAEQLAAVRRIGNIRCAGLAGRDPSAEATLLAQLAATGAVLDPPPLPPAVAELLDPSLRELLAADLPPVAADEMEWEIRSVRQRCAALRGHAPAFALPRTAAGTFAGLAAPPSVSAVLVTRRPEYISEAVRQIAAQSYPELEIVLCLHGIELDADLRARIAGCGRPVQVFTAGSDLAFGEVMGAATARARGSLVTKFDDDDVYGPEHVWDLVLAREFSGATLVGKAAEFVYLQALGVTVRRRAVPPETYGPPVAGGTMLMSRGDLEDIGGWRPVPRSVDRGLMDRVLRAGGLIYRTHPLGYLYERRTAGHTWDAGLDYFLRRSGQQWHGFPRHAEFGTAEGTGVGTVTVVPD